jgi:hypothetical protein
MLCDHFDVLVPVAPVEIVLDAEVWKVDRLIEVRQVVIPRPLFYLAGVPIRSSVAVGASAIVLLQPLLILALELVVEDDAADVAALVAKPRLFAQVGTIELDVVRQLPRPAHAGVEPLFARIGPIKTVGFQEVMAAFCQRHGTLAAVKGYKPGQALVAQMPKVRLTRIVRLVSRVAEIALSDYPKRADGRQRSTVLAVQFVPIIAVDNHLAFESARQFESVEKHISRVAIARIPVSLANVLVAVPRVIIARIRCPCAPEFDPMNVEVARVLITVSRIIPTRVRHRALPSGRHEIGCYS